MNLELEKFVLAFNNTYINKEIFINNFEGSFERLKTVCFHSRLNHEISTFKDNDQFFKFWIWLDMQIVYQQDFSKADDFNKLVMKSTYDNFIYNLEIGLTTLQTIVYLFHHHQYENKNILMNYLIVFKDLIHFSFNDSNRVNLNDYYSENQVGNIQSLFDDYTYLKDEINRYFQFFRYPSADLTSDIKPNLDSKSFSYLDIQEYQSEFDDINNKEQLNEWIANNNWDDDLNVHVSELNWNNPDYE